MSGESKAKKVMTKTIKLEDILKDVRELPWPVHARVEEKGALTPTQLLATRVYRRHAANHLPKLLKIANAILEPDISENERKSKRVYLAMAIRNAETIEVEI